MIQKSAAVKQSKKILPLVSAVFALFIQLALPDSPLQKAAAYPYFLYLLLILSGTYTVLTAVSFFVPRLDSYLAYHGPLYAGIILFFNILNVFTLKFVVLPVLFFPSLDRIIETFLHDRVFLLKCVLFSLRLLATGFFFGAVVDFFSGVLLGFSRRAAYWLNPVVKVLGPIPTTAWIPLALSSFPTSYSASVFLIAFTVWFQVALMTSSGIQSINKSYFEVSRTLGASNSYQIWHVAVPGAMPSIFLGLFNGTCGSFITLMTAEMVGTSAGIGWYINWQKQMMVYSGVYTGLFMIAVICSLILTLLFKVRDRLLVWQKGVIKW